MDTLLEARRGRALHLALGASLAIHAVALSLPNPPHHPRPEERPPLRAELKQALPPPAAKPEAAPQPPLPPRPEPPPKVSRPRPLAVPAPAVAPPVAAPDSAPSQERSEPAPPPAAPPPPAAAKEPAPLVQPGFSAAYLSNPKPAYPLAARRRGESGTVYLKVLVTREGLPGTVELDRSSGSDALDRTALETVKRWRFTPASRAGEPVEAWVRVPLEFRFEGQ